VSGSHGWTPGAAALVVALGGGLLAVARRRRRQHAGRDLSVTRAREHLRQIAAHPHPTGSAAAAAVRDHLVGELRELGMTVRVERHTVGGTSHGGRIENVYAVPAGSPSVLLVAHYDSVPGSPGAADNGMGVAALLEVARVLLRDGERDFAVLFTDGEEAGRLGARAHVDRMTAADRARTVVINLDARGNRGRPVVFEAGPDLRRVRPALAALAPAVTSLADAVYHRLPHDTDLTVFRRAGMSGINLGLIAGSAGYHTAGDTADRLDPRGLAALMADTLAAARALLADRRSPRAARCDTYFPLGGRLVSYPAPLDLAVGAGSLLATAALLGRARAGSRPATAARVSPVRAVALAPLPVVAAAALGAAGWRVARAVRPHYGGFAAGDPHRPGPVLAGQTAVVLAASAALTRWLPTAGRLTGLQTWLGLSAVAGGVLLPGSGYLAAWPAALATACLAAERASGRELTTLRSALLGGSLAALAVPAAALLQPALGLRRTGVPLAILAAAQSTVVPAPTASAPRPAAKAYALLAAAGTASVAAGLYRDRPDRRHPAHIGLCYLRDADSGRAYWLGAADAPSPTATSDAVSVPGGIPVPAGTTAPDGVPTLGVGPTLSGAWQPGPPPETLCGAFPGVAPSWARWADAEAFPTPEPTPRVERRTTAGDGTTVEFSVHAPASVHAVTVQVTVDGPRRPEVTVDDVPLPAARAADGRWVAEIRFAADLSDPLRVVVVAGPGRLVLVASAHSRIPIEWATGPDAAAVWTTGAAGEATTVRRLQL
jgi:hypothetical protein